MQVSHEHRRLGWFALDELDALPLPAGYRRSIRAAADDPAWLGIARELQSLAQSGLYYSKDKFDTQRYERVRELTAEMMAMGSGATVAQIMELFRQDLAYGTPRVGVRAAAFRDDRVLMVREWNDGRWALPGGWADVNRTASECIEREVWEETGFTARAVKLCGLWDRRRHGAPPAPITIYNLYFLCEITGGAPRPSVETSEIGFFAEDELPELSPLRVQQRLIHRMFAHHRQPDLPTEFD
ncbi:MAG: NUDIX hydrolase [Alphaproteobacteria bacterium]|nr:NUDIX hydrolase [Alphaproteobacteria bacterium]